MPTCLGVEYDNTTVTQATDIASDFDINDWIDANPGDGGCSADGSDGKFRINCEPSHLAYDDPILYFGQPGAAHLHQFFGNTLANHSSTYNSLRTTGMGTCEGGPINRTGYWHPAIIRPQNNSVVLPTSYTVYYTVGHMRADRCDVVFGWQYAVQHLPRGFSFICGWPDRIADTTGSTIAVPEDPFYHGGTVGQGHIWGVWGNGGSEFVGNGGTLEELADQCDLEGKCQIPTTNGAEKLIPRFSFPTCWDGVNLSSANGRSHVTYLRQNTYGPPDNPGCPASHPHHIPDVLVGINIDHNGADDFRQWYISSDQGHGPPTTEYPGGHTMHYDWFGGWDQTIVDTFSCFVNGISPCTGVQLGETPSFITCNNGALYNTETKLTGSHQGNMAFRQATTPGLPDYRYAAIPEAPMEHGPGHMSFFGFPSMNMRA